MDSRLWVYIVQKNPGNGIDLILGGPLLKIVIEYRDGVRDYTGAFFADYETGTVCEKGIGEIKIKEKY